MLERDVISKTLRGAKKLGVKWIRLTFMPGTASGWPDYIFILPNGKTVWIEFKATGKQPTPLQAARIQTLKELGHVVRVIDRPDEAINLLKARSSAK